MNATSPPQRHNSKRPLVKNVLLGMLAIALAIVPLFIARNAEFGGADAQAEKAITKIKPEYTPWFSPLWKPPGREIESFLFAMQAAIGINDCHVHEHYDDIQTSLDDVLSGLTGG